MTARLKLDRAPGAFARELDPDVQAWLPLLKETPGWVVVPHLTPDADTLGSSLALARLLRVLGRPAIVACQDPVVQRYDYLPGVEGVVVDAFPHRGLPDGAGAVGLDAATFDRLGRMGPRIAEMRPLVNIDHHVSNPGWGSHNLVDTKAAATGEVVYMLYDFFNVPVDRKTATCLYAALVTDTGGFRYPATTPRTMAVAAELLATGIDAPAIAAAIYERRTAAALRLLGMALASLKVSDDGRLAWITVTTAMFEATGADEEDAETITEKLREIGGVEALFVARESRAGGVRVSMRSKGALDVNQVARAFGGGGHVQSAGCAIAKPLAEVEADLVRAMTEALP